MIDALEAAVPVIDLDQPAVMPAPRVPSRRRRQALVAALMVVSAMAGGAVVFERRELAEDKTVKLLIFAGAGDDGDYDPAADAYFIRQISVVNAGPRRVNIRRVTAGNAALIAASTTTDRWVQPGTAVPVDLYVTMSCAGAVDRVAGSDGSRRGNVSSTLSAAVTVETESTSTRTVTLDAGAWIQNLQDALMACLSANP